MLRRFFLVLALGGAACSDDTSGPGGAGGDQGGGGTSSDGGSGTTGGAGGEVTGGGGTGGEGGSVEMALVHSVGRFDESDPAAPRASWSGTSFRTRIDGTGVDVTLDGPSNVWFQVEVDGAPTSVFTTAQGPMTYSVATDLAPGVHDVEIVRRNEGFFGAVAFGGFTPHDGTELVASPSPYVHTMEFVGDSITCGYGIEGPNGDCDFSADTESVYSTYAAIASRNVGAASHFIAFSGKGMSKNCCGDTGTLMPELYLRTLTADTGPTWDFSRFTPEVVVVNLGTNDFNGGVVGSEYVADYVDFLGFLRESYPAATIVCVTWSFWGASNEALVQDAVDQFADSNVKTLRFTIESGEGAGCDGHPSAVTNARLGEELTTFLQTEVGW